MITKATLDAMLERIKGDKTVNVYEFVRNMRQRRVLIGKKPHLLRRESLRGKTMVTLCNMTEEGEESCYSFWPTTEGDEAKIKYGKIIISLQSQTSYGHKT